MRVSSGGVIRNENGDSIIGYTRNISCTAMLQAELWPILDVIQVAWDRGIRRLEIETDNKEVFRILHSKVGSNEPAIVRLHSELVYNYSGSKHITESLKRCGISENSSYVLAGRFNASPDEKLIYGKEIGLEELEGRADQAQIEKHYKISGPELGISTLADAITCRIAARDAL
ncbi:EKC/KEOPS complex subunit Tprkb-like [Hibiscus syriacus]|uniref:EKC/KEOPS complex subunit Tprkb-like n=1 Tax=Hibiscus syriacus TaxID=106335 RepID=UPI001920C4CD|nr:EKC/KEOPS complex subunit Tprkb-like [Hibiscus syriacus]